MQYLFIPINTLHIDFMHLAGLVGSLLKMALPDHHKAINPVETMKLNNARCLP